MKEREVTTLWNRGCTDPIRALLYPLYRWKYHICAASLWSNPQNAENGGKFPSSKICNAVISTVSKNRNLINLLYYQNLSRILLFLFMHFVLEASSSCMSCYLGRRISECLHYFHCFFLFQSYELWTILKN